MMVWGMSFWALFWAISLSLSLGAEGRKPSTPRPYYDPKDYYDNEFDYADENGNFREPDYLEDDMLPKQGTRWFKYWPREFYDYRHKLNLPVPQEEWTNYWPPRKEDGVGFEIAKGDYNSEENRKIREEYYALQKKFGDLYEEELEKLAPDFKNAVNITDDEDFKLPVLPRPYPFCVDGKLGRHLIPDRHQPGGSSFRNIDPRLERFIPILRTAQPASGIPVIADDKGKPPIKHVEDGIEMGPYVERLYLTFIGDTKSSCAGHHGGKNDWENMMGFGLMANWILLRVHTRLPLEGLYIQAISWPSGLPIGSFRNDASCIDSEEFIVNPTFDEKKGIKPLDMTTVNPQEFLALEGRKENGEVIRKRQTTRVPCKYNYGDNSVDVPEVFAYGGSVPDLDDDIKEEGINKNNQVVWKKRSYFQTALTIDYAGCNLLSSFQLIVIAVRDFANMKYEVFRTIPLFYSRAGYYDNKKYEVAHPYHRSWQKEGMATCGPSYDRFDSEVYCSNLYAYGKLGLHERDDFRYNRKPWPIFPNWEYDNCIRASGEEEDVYRKERDVRESRTGRMSGLWPNHLCKKDLGVEKFSDCIVKSKLGICPPSGNFCRMSKYGRDNGYISYPVVGEFLEQSYNYDVRGKLKEENACFVKSCTNPNYTIPELFVEIHGGGDDDYDDDDSKGSGANGDGDGSGSGEGAGGGFGAGSGSGGKGRLGTKFSESFTKKLYTKGAVYVRRVKSVHTMTMYLAWMTFMGIGTLTARYYKETGGINPEVGNACLGIGYWIWSHYFLFVFSLILMWIGIVSSHSIRRRKVPCNAFDVYRSNTTDLMHDCRYNNQVVRVHKVFGFFAAFFFHCALLVAWVRPTGTLRFLGVTINLRKLGVWTHVLAAYLGKGLCIFSVIVFLFPRASSVCNDIPIWMILTEVVTLAFFAALCVIQWMEDKRDKKDDKTSVPVLEAVEAADKSTCYKIKIIVIIVSVLLHLFLFAMMSISTAASYGKSSLAAAKAGDKTMGQGKAEILYGLFSSTCHAPSLASEEDIRMRHYYYTNKYKQ